MTSRQPFDPYRVIKAPLSTEKSIRKIEAENTLVFVVWPHSTKQMIKLALEKIFTAKVAAVRVQNTLRGERRAYVRFAPGTVAADIGAELGLI